MARSQSWSARKATARGTKRPTRRSPPTCLGLPLETFRYIQADTAEIPEGNGHGGARSMHQGGAALFKAAQQVIAKGKPVAARLLQAQPDEVTFAAGRYSAGERSSTC